MSSHSKKRIESLTDVAFFPLLQTNTNSSTFNSCQNRTTR